MTKKKEDETSRRQKSKGQLAPSTPSHLPAPATSQLDGEILHRRWINRQDDLKDKLKDNLTLESKSYNGTIGYWRAQSLTDEPYHAIHSVATNPWKQDEIIQNCTSGFVAAGSDTRATGGSR